MTPTGAQPTPPLSLDATVCRSEDQLSTEMDGETVLMSIARGSYFNLDAVGTDIWQRLEQPVIVSDLCAQLGREYDADGDTIARDVLALLNQLAAKGLIEVRS